MIFGELSRKFCAKLYGTGRTMETAQMYVGKSWKSIMYHTGSFAMPTTGMCSPFKANSDRCQSPHCFRCWWFILRLAWGWREEKERKLESKREATFLYQTLVSSQPYWKSDYSAPRQQDRQRCHHWRGARAVSSEGEPGTRRNNTTLPVYNKPSCASTTWDSYSQMPPPPFIPGELHLPSKFGSNVLSPWFLRHHSLYYYNSLFTHIYCGTSGGFL